jgi:hypothetical protein
VLEIDSTFSSLLRQTKYWSKLKASILSCTHLSHLLTRELLAKLRSLLLGTVPHFTCLFLDERKGSFKLINFIFTLKIQ